jgi:hypothetical protein
LGDVAEPTILLRCIITARSEAQIRVSENVGT